MDSKQNYGIIIAVIGIVGAAAGGSFALDFSTNIGQIGDINTIIQNQLGIDLDEFKKMCEEGIIDEEFEQYCRLV